VTGTAPSKRAEYVQNEQILNAYALNPGGVIGFIDEGNVTFRPKGSAVLVLACIG
jgi:hypothetical protein